MRLHDAFLPAISCQACSAHRRLRAFSRCVSIGVERLTQRLRLPSSSRRNRSTPSSVPAAIAQSRASCRRPFTRENQGTPCVPRSPDFGIVRMKGGNSHDGKSCQVRSGLRGVPSDIGKQKTKYEERRAKYEKKARILRTSLFALRTLHLRWRLCSHSRATRESLGVRHRQRCRGFTAFRLSL